MVDTPITLDKLTIPFYQTYKCYSPHKYCTKLILQVFFSINVYSCWNVKPKLAICESRCF